MGFTPRGQRYHLGWNGQPADFAEFNRRMTELSAQAEENFQILFGDLNQTAKSAGGDFHAAIGSSLEAWDADLDAIAALNSTGLAARIGSNSWALPETNTSLRWLPRWSRTAARCARA